MSDNAERSGIGRFFPWLGQRLLYQALALPVLFITVFITTSVIGLAENGNALLWTLALVLVIVTLPIWLGFLIGYGIGWVLGFVITFMTASQVPPPREVMFSLANTVAPFTGVFVVGVILDLSGYLGWIGQILRPLGVVFEKMLIVALTPYYRAQMTLSPQRTLEPRERDPRPLAGGVLCVVVGLILIFRPTVIPSVPDGAITSVLPWVSGSRDSATTAVDPATTARTYVRVANAESLNVRAGPDTEAAIVAIVHAGDVLSVLDQQNKWVQVELPDQTVGWVSGAYVISTEGRVARWR